MMLKLLVTFCALFLLVSPTLSAIFDDLPGLTEEEKIMNLQRGIAQFRNYIAGQACFTRQFQDPSNPEALERWVGWFCTYFGGPANATNCTYTDLVSSEPLTEVGELEAALVEFHNPALNISNEQNDLFIELLAKAIALTGDSSNPNLEADIIANLTAIAVVSEDNANDTCPTADLTLPWSVASSTGQNETISIESLVTWVWEDTARHAVAPDSGETIVLPGFGGGLNTLRVVTECNSTSAAYPDGGIPCNLGGGDEFSYSHFFEEEGVLNYHCPVHPSMNGRLTINGTLPGETGTSTSETSMATSETSGTVDEGDGDGDQDTDEEEIGSSAVVLQAWWM